MIYNHFEEPKERSGLNEKNMDYNTICWKITIGVNSGYDLEEQVKMPMKDITEIYLKTAEEVCAKTGVYISAVISESRTLYSPEWGCPEEGEYSYTLSGGCNPAFAKQEEYLKALNMIAKLLKERLKQSTLLLEISPANLIYMTDDQNTK